MYLKRFCILPLNDAIKIVVIFFRKMRCAAILLLLLISLTLFAETVEAKIERKEQHHLFKRRGRKGVGKVVAKVVKTVAKAVRDGLAWIGAEKVIEDAKNE